MPEAPDRPGGPEDAARTALEAALGPGDEASVGASPGRVTLIGDHVDYIGGRVACTAIDLGLAVGVRRSRDGHWRAAGLGARVQRDAPEMAGDIGDRLFAAAVALQRRGVEVAPLEMAVTGDLPASAGLSSSAAVVTAAVVAILRLQHLRVTAEDLVGIALAAERDVVGVPCGELDQRALVHSRGGSVLILDCAVNDRWRVVWPWPRISLLVVASGERHDVGGGEYRSLRRAAEGACTALAVASCQEIGDRWEELSPDLRPAGRHIASETRRTDQAVGALRAADPAALGRLMNESHLSLRRDCGASTRLLDSMVAAARGVRGCHGARLTGAGFGGSIVALVERPAAAACAAAVAAAGATGGAWLVHPSDGLEVSAPDAVVA